MGLTVDNGRGADWGKTSQDYARHRPGPPSSFYAKLQENRIGLSGQKVLDLGTGTGVLALQFASQGCAVSASDISTDQVEMAKELAAQAALQIDFKVGRGSHLDFPDNHFDIVTACQCWWYFDHDTTLSEIKRVLKPFGRLVICFFSFLPRQDLIVAASEKLVLKYNPDWSGADWDGDISIWDNVMPDEGLKDAMFAYDEAIPFTRESWRGRMRALRGIGASLSEAEVLAFDDEHNEILKQMAGESFEIQHRIDAHIYKLDTKEDILA